MKKLITSMIDTIQYNPLTTSVFDLEQEKNDLPVLRPSLVLFTTLVLSSGQIFLVLRSIFIQEMKYTFVEIVKKPHMYVKYN